MSRKNLVPPLHPAAWRVLEILAELGNDGGTDPGGPLHDVYRIRRLDRDAPLDAAITRWCDAGCPVDYCDPGSRRREDILLRIRERPGHHTVATLAEATGLTPRMVRNHLGRLQADHLLIGVEPGSRRQGRFDELVAVPLTPPKRRKARSTTR